ncbi:MAG: MATE family efflux transporter [Lachnospiraceae bacterium]|nr:MATE family efflux transporter [Lachnospiraceae bacterium]
MRKEEKKIDMTQGALLPQILVFALPLILSGMLQLLFNAADIIVVGKFAGSNALGAVGANSSLINFFVNIFIGLSIGANVTAAKYLGAKKPVEVSDTVHTSVVLAFITGVAIMVAGILLARPILTFMETPDEILDLAVLYLRIYFCGMPVMVLYNFGASLLRAVGDTKRPLVYLLIAGVINVILNLIFVIQFHMSVAGVALATIISQCASTVMVIRCLVLERGSMRLFMLKEKLKVSPERLKEIIAVGLPAGVQGVLFSISNILIQSTVNSFGAIAVAGNTAASNIEGFIYVAMNASYQACVSFTGQNFGARKFDRILKVLLLCALTGTLTGIIMGMPAYFILGTKLLSFYSSDAQVIAYGMKRLSIIAPTYALCVIMEVPVGTMRGMGRGVLPVIVSLIGACGFRILWIMTVFKMYPTLETLYISYPVSWILTALAQFILAFFTYRRLKDI